MYFLLLYRDESTAMYLRSVILDLFGKKLYLELYCQHNNKNNNNNNKNNNNNNNNKNKNNNNNNNNNNNKNSNNNNNNNNNKNSNTIEVLAELTSDKSGLREGNS
jgi:hypothetical protein